MSRPRGNRGRFVSKAMIMNGFSDANPRACEVCGVTQTTQWRSGPRGESLCNADGIRAARAERTARARARQTSVHALSHVDSFVGADDSAGAPVAGKISHGTASLARTAFTNRAYYCNNNLNYGHAAHTPRHTTSRHNYNVHHANQFSAAGRSLGPKLHQFKPSTRGSALARPSSSHLIRTTVSRGEEYRSMLPPLSVPRDSMEVNWYGPTFDGVHHQSSHSSLYISSVSHTPKMPSSPVSSSPDSSRTSSCHDVCSLRNLLN